VNSFVLGFAEVDILPTVPIVINAKHVLPPEYKQRTLFQIEAKKELF
jgi:hypothetical protein